MRADFREQKVYAALLTELGARLRIPSALESSKLLNVQVSPRRVFSLYPFEISEWKDPRWFMLSRDHVKIVLSRLARQHEDVVQHLPANHRQVVRQLSREYDAELARLDGIRRAHSMNVSASEDWEEARYQLLTAAYVLNALRIQPLGDDGTWSQEEADALIQNLPPWEASVLSLVVALRPIVPNLLPAES